MALVLARIDDRLIHGQVTVGWAMHLNPDRILLANNEIAADQWQCEVYASSVSPNMKVSILSIAEAASFLLNPDNTSERTILLTASAGDMAGLVGMGLDLDQVNVGGLHFGPGKKEMLPFVYLGRLDFTPLRQLLDRGVSLMAQQVPGGFEHDIDLPALVQMEARF